MAVRSAVTANNGSYKVHCKHCLEKIAIKGAGEHLALCAPEVHEAIAEEFIHRELAAMKIGRQGMRGLIDISVA